VKTRFSRFESLAPEFIQGCFHVVSIMQQSCKKQTLRTEAVRFAGAEPPQRGKD
jgi:hypothetical protein